MMNLNLFAAIRALFTTFITTASAVERVAKSIDNVAKLGEEYTDNMVKEQAILQKARIADMEAKAAKKYKAEKEQWEDNL